ncbi:DUF4880 domain-containing protein [Pseudothauera nasutitermitis]|uniref:DUF4880 domain-containing protein n=1 Tax=Pseudothauera nasutitermitis TaxID=2565930 RepID=A0A4S4B0X5_9RHOO|nr:FecR domain-containing protein [Pseudothauera nasutitermitis]THF66182.1 DUF4880 domain-containing protein [Pseudothauera nasutitermitis]
MKSGEAAAGEIDPAILQEAADWLMRLHAGDAGPQEWAAVECWRTTSPAHGRAWQRAEALLGDLRQLPPGPARAALERPNARRRQLLRLLWIPALPAGLLAWRQFSVDGERWQSATGEQRPLTLADGTQVLLNTATRIAVRFDAQTRLLRLLEGEILVTSAPDSAPVHRPLIVATGDGSARAIGTRFSVRRADGDDASRVVVFDGAVEVEAGGTRRTVKRGEHVVFGADGPGTPAAFEAGVDEAWTQGMVIARRMRLADLLAELERYRPGLLRCHPAVADLRVSGSFPVLETDRSLALLAATLPVRVRYRTRYWAIVEPA